jgi:hypothetical protein
MDVFSESVEAHSVIAGKSESVIYALHGFTADVVRLSNRSEIAPSLSVHYFDGDLDPGPHSAARTPLSDNLAAALRMVASGKPSAAAISAVFSRVFPIARIARM